MTSENLEKLRRPVLWVARKVLKRIKAGVAVAGYYNGSCPVCGVHIGTDVLRDKLTQAFYCFCGACGREIYPVLDHSRIRWLKLFKPGVHTERE